MHVSIRREVPRARRLAVSVLAALAIIAVARPAPAQTVEERLRTLEAEVAELREALTTARRTIDDLRDAACDERRPASCRRRQGRCELPADPGPCEAAIASFWFDAASGTCKRFTYGGCGGNDNRFATKAECSTVCGEVELPRCEQPADPGPCNGAIGRWFHDPASGSCDAFTYGGCLGNDNNFDSQEACERACRVQSVPVCEQPLDAGPCDAALRRFRYDARTDECVQFTYGGCLGNENNFATRNECNRACRPRTSPCTLAPDPGPCDAAIPRWSFDAGQGTCSQFTYGGCGGNENNFTTRAGCERACGTPPDRPVCEQPRDPGPCDAVISRWWYDGSAAKCREFTWGGCGGNENRFESAAACERACIVDP